MQLLATKASCICSAASHLIALRGSLFVTAAWQSSTAFPAMQDGHSLQNELNNCISSVFSAHLRIRATRSCAVNCACLCTVSSSMQ